MQSRSGQSLPRTAFVQMRPTHIKYLEEDFVSQDHRPSSLHTVTLLFDFHFSWIVSVTSQFVFGHKTNWVEKVVFVPHRVTESQANWEFTWFDSVSLMKNSLRALLYLCVISAALAARLILLVQLLITLLKQPTKCVWLSFKPPHSRKVNTNMAASLETTSDAMIRRS